MHYGGIRSRGMVIHIECQLICLIGFIYRHNGVVIEPTEAEKKKKGSPETEPQASGSKSKSRSLSPSSKDKENPSPTPPPPLGGPQGPHSYYRPHTLSAGGKSAYPLANAPLKL